MLRIALVQATTSNMRRRNLVLGGVTLALLIFFFIPFIPAGGPCPWGAKCFNLRAAAANGYGSVSYVLVGFGANGAYPIKDFLHNESGHYIPVDNYLEGNYGFSACNKGEEWALMYGGPWGCYILFDFYWNL